MRPFLWLPLLLLLQLLLALRLLRCATPIDFTGLYRLATNTALRRLDGAKCRFTMLGVAAFDGIRQPDAAPFLPRCAFRLRGSVCPGFPAARGRSTSQAAENILSGAHAATTGRPTCCQQGWSVFISCLLPTWRAGGVADKQPYLHLHTRFIVGTTIVSWTFSFAAGVLNHRGRTTVSRHEEARGGGVIYLREVG